MRKRIGDHLLRCLGIEKVALHKTTTLRHVVGFRGVAVEDHLGPRIMEPVSNRLPNTFGGTGNQCRVMIE